MTGKPCWLNISRTRKFLEVFQLAPVQQWQMETLAHIVDSEEAERHHMGAPFGACAAGTAAGSDATAVEHDRHVVGSFRLTGLTGDHGGAEMEAWWERQPQRHIRTRLPASTELKVLIRATKSEPTNLKRVFDSSDSVELFTTLEFIWTPVSQAGIQPAAGWERAGIRGKKIKKRKEEIKEKQGKEKGEEGEQKKDDSTGVSKEGEKEKEDRRELRLFTTNTDETAHIQFYKQA